MLSLSRVSHPDYLSVVPVKTVFTLGPTVFPICSSLDLPVLKNSRCGEEEPKIKSTFSFTCHLLEKQVDEPSPLSAKVPVVI